MKYEFGALRSGPMKDACMVPLYTQQWVLWNIYDVKVGNQAIFSMTHRPVMDYIIELCHLFSTSHNYLLESIAVQNKCCAENTKITGQMVYNILHYSTVIQILTAVF